MGSFRERSKKKMTAGKRRRTVILSDKPVNLTQRKLRSMAIEPLEL